MYKPQPKTVSSSIQIPEDGTITYNYTDGTTETLDMFTGCPIVIPEPKQLAKGIDQLTKDMEAMQAKRKAEGRCVSCNELLEMTIYGLKDCEKCLN